MSRVHLGVVVAFLISGFMGLFILPQEIETTRWIIIDSAPKQAWPIVSRIENWQIWDPWKQSGSANGHNWNYGGVVTLESVSQSEYVPNIEGMVDVFGGEFKADVGIWSPSSYKDTLPKLMRIGEQLDDLGDEPSEERTKLLRQRDGFAARAKVYEALSRQGLVIDGQTLVLHLFDGDVLSAQSQIESWKVDNKSVYSVEAPSVDGGDAFLLLEPSAKINSETSELGSEPALLTSQLFIDQNRHHLTYVVSEEGGFGEIALEVIPDGLWVMWRHTTTTSYSPFARLEGWLGRAELSLSIDRGLQLLKDHLEKSAQ